MATQERAAEKVATPSSGRVAKPVRMGVLTAPKTTEILLPKRAKTTAVTGVKPKPTKIGATMVEGVPKPAIPSIKFSKNQAKIIT